MKKNSFLKIVLVVFATICMTQLSFAAPETTVAPEYSQPLGSAMETYPYPFPVKFLPLEIEGQPVRMAYMDVQFQFFAPPPLTCAW